MAHVVIGEESTFEVRRWGVIFTMSPAYYDVLTPDRPETHCGFIVHHPVNTGISCTDGLPKDLFVHLTPRSRTPFPFWRQTILRLGSLSPKRDCGI